MLSAVEKGKGGRWAGGTGCHFKTEGPAPTYQAAGPTGSGLPSLRPQKAWGSEQRAVIWMGQGRAALGGTEAPGKALTGGCLSGAAPGSRGGRGLESTPPGQASLVDICLAVCPIFM